MKTINEKLRSPVEHICSQCEKTFTEIQSLLRHVRTRHRGIWKCSRCQAKHNREDTFNYHERNYDFQATRKRYNTNQIRGGVPKWQMGNILDSHSRALEHTMDQFTVNLTVKLIYGGWPDARDNYWHFENRHKGSKVDDWSWIGEEVNAKDCHCPTFR